MLKLITGPASEPVSLVEAKAHLGVGISIDDTLITSLIKGAREQVEQELGRSLISQTWELALDCFLDEILLPMGDVIAITSVAYLDGSNVLQTLATNQYVLDNYSNPARVKAAYATQWPETYPEINAVKVRYTAGYANAAAVPETIKDWIKIRIGSMYEHREELIAGVPVAKVDYIDRLLDRYKLWKG